jgi:hypothetical protein
MSREIRITIDDDEVFEHMKRRKARLDLSWEDVLRRGLRGGDDLGSVTEEFERRLRNQIATSLRASLPGGGPGQDAGVAGGRGPGGFESGGGFPPGDDFETGTDPAESETDEFGEEIADLADAEDALLVFPVLDADDEGPVVPLRVRLRFDGEGLSVTVVTVRQGKSVADANRFRGDARRRIVRDLATGGTAVLRLGDGDEEYPVRPVLDWGRDDSGRPTVTDVEIAEVVFDDVE